MGPSDSQTIQHNKHITMALSLFDSVFFPMSRAARPSLGHMLSPRGAFFDNNLFAEMDERRNQFLQDMNHLPEATDGKPGYSRSFSYSSSTFKNAGSEPVSQRTESFRASDGQSFSRSIRSVGNQSVEETVKGDETTRTLHNIEEGDLEGINQTVEQHTSQSPFQRFGQLLSEDKTVPALQATSTSTELPAALQADLTKLKQAHQ